MRGGTSLIDPPPPVPPEVTAGDRLERRLRLWAPPAAFALAFALMASPAGRSLSRTFLTMWVHEIGHAATAWLTGFGAFPGPWRTPVSSQRVIPLALLFAALLAWLTVRAYRADRRILAAASGSLLALQLAGSFALSAHRARMLFSFGGDAGMFVLGALGAATFFAPRGSHLHRSWLRWGFLVIGALAFADAAATWWSARSDPAAIPFGEIEGVGLSDSSELSEVHGWSDAQLVSRHLTVAALSAAALVVVWGRAVRNDRRAALGTISE